MTATKAKSSGQRVVSVSSLLPLTPVRNPINGSNRPNAIAPVKTASRSAPVTLTRSLWTRSFCAPAAISDLLDVRPAEQALRQENQRDHQDGKGGDIFVVDGKVCRPERLDQPDQ